MTENLIQPSQPDASKPFQDMADRIRANKDQVFGGAFVCVPPTNGGGTLETLILDVNQDPAQYYTLLKTKADVELGKVEERNRQNSPFGRR